MLHMERALHDRGGAREGAGGQALDMASKALATNEVGTLRPAEVGKRLRSVQLFIADRTGRHARRHGPLERRLSPTAVHVGIF